MALPKVMSEGRRQPSVGRHESCLMFHNCSALGNIGLLCWGVSRLARLVAGLGGPCHQGGLAARRRLRYVLPALPGGQTVNLRSDGLVAVTWAISVHVDSCLGPFRGSREIWSVIRIHGPHTSNVGMDSMDSRDQFCRICRWAPLFTAPIVSF